MQMAFSTVHVQIQTDAIRKCPPHVETLPRSSGGVLIPCPTVPNTNPSASITVMMVVMALRPAPALNLQPFCNMLSLRQNHQTLGSLSKM